MKSIARLAQGIMVFSLVAMHGALQGCTEATGRATTSAPLTADDVDPTLSQGIQVALRACKLDDVKFYVSQGIGPNTLISVKGKIRESTGSVFGVAVSSVPEPKGVRPPTAPPSARYNYFVDEAGYYRRHSSWNRIQKCMEVVKYLIDQGAIVEDPRFSDYPRMHTVAKKQLVELAELLVRHGANPHSVNKFGETPLLNFARFSPVFYRKGRCATDGSVCSHQSMQNRYFYWLIDNSTPEDINFQGPRGHTGLIIAVKFAMSHNQEDVMLARTKIWLDAGADPCLRDDEGNIAADYAVARNWLALREQLKCSR